MAGKVSRSKAVNRLVGAISTALNEEVDAIINDPVMGNYVTYSEVASAVLAVCKEAVYSTRKQPSVSQPQVRLALQGILFLTEPVGQVHNAEIRPIPAVEPPALHEVGGPERPRISLTCMYCGHLWGAYEDECHCPHGVCHNGGACTSLIGIKEGQR